MEKAMDKAQADEAFAKAPALPLTLSLAVISFAFLSLPLFALFCSFFVRSLSSALLFGRRGALLFTRLGVGFFRMTTLLDPLSFPFACLLSVPLFSLFPLFSLIPLHVLLLFFLIIFSLSK